MKNERIELKELRVEGNKIIYAFESTLPFFKKKSFFVEYEKDIAAPESIAVIPFAAVMSPISWATGADLILPSLDRKYAGSLEHGEQYFKRWLAQRWPFDGKLKAPLADNRAETSKSGVLFSGGLDSLTTYVRYKNERPDLFIIFGADIPIMNARFIQLCKDTYSKFAEEQNVRMNCVYTDVRQTYHDKDLRRYSFNWYGQVAHGMMLTSMVAPLAYKDLKTLYIASSHTTAAGIQPWGSDKPLDDGLAWVNTGVIHDNEDRNRFQKIAFDLKGHHDVYKYLRVCWSQFQEFNCSHCEKCMRTISDLLLNDIDPSLCNFRVSKGTFVRLKEIFSKRYKFYGYFQGREGVMDYWREMRRSIDVSKINDRYGSKEFFEWFRHFDDIDRKQNKVLVFIFLRLARLKQRFFKSQNSGVLAKP